MTAGLAAAEANAQLNVYRGNNITAAAGYYVQLHTGDPGSAGTSNVSAVTTRNQATWAAPSGGSMALSALAAYSMTTSETISHVSVWDAASGGNFKRSVALTSSKAVQNGDTLTLTTLTLAYTPIAA